ncbi:MAG: cell division protein FtsQ/DivIB [Promicromonosporaceae bacterium]|nr:cell division protein FtsQ/DivIB [Promicromonosporaceae bacterium]
MRAPVAPRVMPVKKQMPTSAVGSTVKRLGDSNAPAPQGNRLPTVPTPSSNLGGVPLTERPSTTVTPIQPYLKESRRKRRWRRVGIIAASVFGGAVLAGLVWLFAFSPLLVLRADGVRVSVDTDLLVAESKIVQLLDPRLGTPLARLNLARIRGEVEAVTGVDQARISRSWPGGVEIQVTSRTPAAAIPFAGGYTWVDASGVVVGQKGDAGELPRLEVDTEEPRLVVAALEVWRELPDQLRGETRNIAANSVDSLGVTLTSGQVIHLGSVEQLKLKIATAQALMANSPSARVFDVSSPTLPVTR